MLKELSDLIVMAVGMCARLRQSCPTLQPLWTITHQAPLSKGFFRHEYWSGLPCPPPGNLPNPGIKPTSLMSPASGSLRLAPPGKPTDSRKRLLICHVDGIHGWVCIVLRFFFNCYKLKRNSALGKLSPAVTSHNSNSDLLRLTELPEEPAQLSGTCSLK